MRMRKLFRISPQQSIHQASSDSENYDIKLGDWGRGEGEGEGGRIIRVDFTCVTTKSA